MDRGVKLLLLGLALFHFVRSYCEGTWAIVVEAYLHRGDLMATLWIWASHTLTVRGRITSGTGNICFESPLNRKQTVFRAGLLGSVGRYVRIAFLQFFSVLKGMRYLIEVVWEFH